MTIELNTQGRVYRVYGMRRSGQHAIIRWLLRQLAGLSVFLNDLDPSDDPLRVLQVCAERPMDRSFSDGLEVPLPIDGQIDNLIYNHEDCPVERHCDLQNQFSVYNILVLRDPYNLFASRYLFWTRLDPSTPRWVWNDANLWTQHARTALSEHSTNRLTVIHLERWQSELAYRQMLADKLGLRFTDNGHKAVDHIGSTFDQHKFTGRADEMRITERWRVVSDSPLYRQAVLTDEINLLVNQLYPHHPACAALSAPRAQHTVDLASVTHSLQQGHLTQALLDIVLICHLQPANLQAWYLLAAVNAQRGAMDDVISCCLRALQLAPDHPDIQYNLGTAYLHLKRYQEAIELYERLTRQQPSHATAFANLALAYRECGRTQEAIASSRRALELNPELHAARNTLGLAYLDRGDYATARDCFTDIIRHQPAHVDAHANLGLTHLRLTDPSRAEQSLRRALELNPASSFCLAHLAQALSLLNRNAEALELLSASLDKVQDDALIHRGLGLCHTQSGDIERALEHFRLAVLRNPRDPGMLCNLGNTYLFMNQVDSALECYDGALRLDPQHANAHWHRAWVLLLTGRLREGWAEYEWRFKAEVAHYPDFAQPRWQGESLPDKRILLFTEQGFGDSLQFIRYAALVKQRVGHVIVQCRDELKRLFSTAAGVDEVIGTQESLPAFDVQAPLLSLPLLFGTELDNIPRSQVYLTVPPGVSIPCHEAGPSGSYRIGLTWSGNPDFPWNHFRSCSLEDLLLIGCLPGVVLHSLQKGSAATVLKQHPDIIDLGSVVDDFADTAAAMQALDLIITTDTSVAHLAGALGRETWLLLSYAADWRWLQDREDSPWYPSLRLFRQPTRGDWHTPIQQLNELLKQRLHSHRISP